MIELFVPGRLCIVGEHSDWASQYGRHPGYAIIIGTNQGIYARAERADTLHLHSRINGQEYKAEFRMEERALRGIAASGGFFSYAAGTAGYMMRAYAVSGAHISNYHMDLPLKKGLSSSAALCVLTARAFNQLYQLGLSIDEEMEAAYRGERLTPSQCGRMDQGCAYGNIPVFMEFYRNELKTERINCCTPLHLLLVDLNGEKDTVRILADLNRGYTDSNPLVADKVHRYLGPVNAELVHTVKRTLEEGDIDQLAHCMKAAQHAFDDHLMAVSPTDLTAHRLHRILEDPECNRRSLGGKGVGSQGDGFAQFLCRDPEQRMRLEAYITERYGYECIVLNVAAAPRSGKETGEG